MNKKCKGCIFKVFDCCLHDCDVDADFCDDFEERELDFNDYERCIEFELMEEMIREAIEERESLDICSNDVCGGYDDFEIILEEYKNV